MDLLLSFWSESLAYFWRKTPDCLICSAVVGNQEWPQIMKTGFLSEQTNPEEKHFKDA